MKYMTLHQSKIKAKNGNYKIMTQIHFHDQTLKTTYSQTSPNSQLRLTVICYAATLVLIPLQHIPYKNNMSFYPSAAHSI
jgi:hypothetical protein